MKSRNISIDIIKFFAALLITNSHMEILYHPHEILATGGAIGDVLFFFASGFTLFLGRMGRFDNWYKRRINRIYPTVFAWAILSTLFFSKQYDIIHILLYGGGWFCSCIMLYYIVLYFVRRYMVNHLNYVFLITSIIVIIWYLVIERPVGYNMYGATYFKWGHYFLFMLLGAYIGKEKQTINIAPIKDALLLLLSIILFYGIHLAGKKYITLENYQILSLLPLLSLTFYLYKVCNNNFFNHLYTNKITGPIIRTIGGLCLEIYLVQRSLFTDKMNNIFPLNIIIMLFIIIVAAYILRCVARLFSQTFRHEDYSRKQIFSFY